MGELYTGKQKLLASLDNFAPAISMPQFFFWCPKKNVCSFSLEGFFFPMVSDRFRKDLTDAPSVGQQAQIFPGTPSILVISPQQPCIVQSVTVCIPVSTRLLSGQAGMSGNSLWSYLARAMAVFLSPSLKTYCFEYLVGFMLC